jgi:capsular exopolysaccharide synthesis family protein
MALSAGNEGPAAGTETAPPPVLSAAPTVWGLLSALKQRWRLAVTLGVIFSLVTTAVTFYLSPPHWRARTQLTIATNQPFVLFPNADPKSDFANYQRAQMAVIKSRLVMESALQKPEVACLDIVREQSDPVEWLQNHLEVDFNAAPEILTIALSGDHPEELKVLVNAVREAYLKEIVNREHNLRVNRLNKLQVLYDKYDDLLRDKRIEMRDKAERLGSRDSKTLALKQQFAYTYLNTVQAEYLQTQSVLRATHLDHANLKSRHQALASLPIPASAVDDHVQKDPLVLVAAAKMLEQEKKVADLRATFTNPDREKDVAREEAALKALRVVLEARRKEVRDGAADKLRERQAGETRAELEATLARVERLQKLEKTLKDEVEQRTKDAQDLSKGAIGLEWLQEEIAKVEHVSKQVGGRVEALKVELEPPERVTLLEDTVATQVRTRSRQLQTAGGAGLIAFLVVLFGVALWEFRARRVSGSEDITRGLGMRLVGSLPLLPDSALRPTPGAHRPRDRQWQHLLTESVDAARAVLLHMITPDSLRVVMVTSAGPGEGKTFLSSHLAASLARAGLRTLLIDCDLRKPSLHRLFGLPDGPGISELLRGETDLTGLVPPQSVDGLWVLPAGRCNTASIRALAQGRLGNIFLALQGGYDVVVVDSPPVLPVADSLLIGRHADVVLFSVLRGVSRLPSVYAAYERLALLNFPILGAVVAGAHPDFDCARVYGTAVGVGPAPPVEPPDRTPR